MTYDTPQAKSDMTPIVVRGHCRPRTWDDEYFADIFRQMQERLDEHIMTRAREVLGPNKAPPDG